MGVTITRNMTDKAFVLGEASVAVVLGVLLASAPFYAIALVGLGIALLMPRWLLLTVSIVVAQTMPGLLVSERVLASDVLLGLVVVRGIIDWLRSETSETPNLRVVAPLLIFFAWAWIAIALTDTLDTGTALARVTLYGLVLVATASDSDGSRPFMVSIALFALVEGTLAIAGITPVEDGRIIGLYGDPQQTGILLLAGLSTASLLPRPLRWLTYGITGFGIFLTKTRSTSIATAVALVAKAWPGVRRTKIAVVVVFGLIVLLGWWLVPVATSRLDLNPGSVALRTDSWQSGTNLIERSPVFGHGWAVGGAVEANRSTSPPYNLWINLAASTGVLGAVLFSIFVIRLFGATLHSRAPEAIAAFPFLLGFMAQSLGEMTLYAASSGTMLFMALAGAALAATSRERRRIERFRPYPEVATALEPAGTTRWRGSPPR